MPNISPDHHNDSAQWNRSLEQYTQDHQQPPSSPPPHSSVASSPSLETPLYPPGEISAASARTVAEFYDQYGFLPPPRADEETVRLQTIQEYNLFRQDQIENFHRCSSLVNTFFHFAPVCTISLFHNDVHSVVSMAGEFPVEIDEDGLPEKIIREQVALNKREITELSELPGDWRFAGNPWSVNSTGVKGYVGVPFTLEIDPSNPNDSERVTVGVVAVMSNRPLPKLTDTQRKVLDDLSTMLSVQLRSTWEGCRRGKETRLRNAVSLFLEKALVEPSQQAVVHAAAALVEPRVQGAEPPANPSQNVKTLTDDLFVNAAKQIQELLEADFAVIIDLTGFHATKMNDRKQRSHSWIYVGLDAEAEARLSRRILGSSSSAVYSGHEKQFNTPQAMADISAFLDMHVVTGHSVFSGSGRFSGLERLLALPPNPSKSPPMKAFGVSKGTTVPHLALPFYSANNPQMLIIVASAAPFASFKPADVTFISNVGLVLVARLAQNAIVEADAAKTAFVSQISHELRTPLHGLLGQLDLLRESLSTGDLSMLPSLLDSAEYCGTALREIVDDVLDFGKMAQSSREGGDANTSARPRHVLVDLAQLTVESARSCWMRRLKWQSISGAPSALHTDASPADASPAHVELVVDYEDRSAVKNWWISLDVSGFMRILNNLLTNSLKYTPAGWIGVSLMSGRGPHGDPQITLRVEDSGIGIQPEFLARLFEPFTQADSFSPGAGLGLHICKSIIDRMHGGITVGPRAGGGSVFTVVFPVEEIELLPAGVPLTMVRKVISLDSLPGHTVAPPPAHNLGLPTAPVMQTLNVEAVEQHLKILVVDDNVISRKILVAMLQKLNATAYQADDGLNALKVFREVQPQVVWTDISMPRMDGVTAAKEMRSIERELGWTPAHIVAITGLGLSDEHIRREALLGPAAIDGWLIKGQTNLKTMKENLVAVRRKLIRTGGSTPTSPKLTATSSFGRS